MKEKNIIHRVCIPILYTLLWGISSLCCAFEVKIVSVTFPISAQVVTGITMVYLSFLVECIINLFDIANVHCDESFNIRIIYWTLLFVCDVVLTIVTSICFFVLEKPTAYLGILVVLMCFLKFINASMSNNIDKYMRPIKFKTHISTF